CLPRSTCHLACYSSFYVGSACLPLNLSPPLVSPSPFTFNAPVSPAPYTLSPTRRSSDLNRVFVTKRILSAAAQPLRSTTVAAPRSEEHTSELQSRFDLVCRLLLEKKKENRAEDAGADLSCGTPAVGQFPRRPREVAIIED